MPRVDGMEATTATETYNKIQTMNIKITYSHRSAQTTDSIDSARSHVRTALIQSYRSADAADEMVEVNTDDGIYCYASQADADRDDTGANAYALIERVGGRNAR